MRKKQAANRFAVEILEDRRLLAGVTILTHGFQLDSSFPQWVDSMAYAITQRTGTPGADVSLYKLTISSSLATSLQRLAGPTPKSSTTGETVIELDWSSISSFNVTSTSTVATAVVQSLLSSSAATGLGGALAELPFHLIGHSRGGSLVAELAKKLGQKGIWVDQVTTLDPHPLSGLDPAAETYDNVVFADDYYRTGNGGPDGAPVDGAHTVDLNGIVIGDPFSFDAHTGVHAYYYGTVNIGASDDGDGFTIDPSWYTFSDSGPSSEVGFNWSRVGGGPRPNDGIWSPANRTPVALTATGANAWDNIIIGDYTTGTTKTIGSRITETPTFGDGNSDAFITIGLDTDENPYNGVTGKAETKHTASGVSFSVDTTGLTAGQKYYLYGKITNGTHTRYYYAQGAITMTTTPAVPGPHIDGVSPSSFQGKPLGQLRTITISGSGFTTNSTLKFNDGYQNYYSQASRLHYIDSTHIDYDISVGPNAANWTVQVLDAQKSNIQPFTVTGATVSYTKSWTGAISSDWNATGNWSPAGVPQAGDHVIITGGVVNTSGFHGEDVSLAGGAVLNWTSGRITGSDTALIITAGCVFNITGSGDRNWSGEVFNAGTINVNMSGGSLHSGDLYVPFPDALAALDVYNLSTGLFNFQSDTDLASGFGPITFNNAGTLRKSGGTATWLNSDPNYGAPFTINNGGTVEVTSGTLGFDGGAGTFFSEGTLNTSLGAAIYLRGDATFDNSATSTGSGTVNLWGWLNGTLNGSNYVLTGLYSGALTLNGTMNWASGYIYDTVLTIASGAVFNITGSGDRYWYGDVYNEGTINANMSSGNIYNGGFPSSINNLAGGLFDIQSDMELGVYTFNNAGTLRKSGGTADSYLSGVLNNFGTVQVISGTLGVRTFYTEGTLNTSSGAAINLDGDSTFDTAATSTGSGTVNLWGTLNGTLNGSNFVLQHFSAGALTLNGTMNWTLGYIYGGTVLTIGSGSVLNITGSGDRDWSGEVFNAGTINVKMSSGNLFAGYLWTNAPLMINNLSGGVFDLQGDTGLQANHPITFNNAGTLRKSGGAATAFDRIGTDFFTFNNSGTVQVSSGTLAFNGTFYSAGTLNTSSGATISLSGVATFDTGAASTGLGTVNLQGTFNGTFNGPNYVLNGFYGGALTLNGTMNWASGSIGDNAVLLTITSNSVLNITGNGTRSWSGDVYNEGTINVNISGGTIVGGVSGSINRVLTINNLSAGRFNFQSDAYLAPQNSIIFNNAGTIVQADGTTVGMYGVDFVVGGVVVNHLPLVLNNLPGGVYDMLGSSVLQSFAYPFYYTPSNTINNAGTFRKSSGGTSSLDSGITFNNTGTVDVDTGTLSFENGIQQNSGNLFLNWGSISSGALININGGTLTGNGVVNASVVSSGVVSPGVGTLTINGDYTQASTGRLRISISGSTPGAQCGQLIVTGTATLSGRLNLFRDPAFLTAAYTPLNFLTCGARTGVFSGIDGSEAGGGLVFAADYNPTGASLMAVLGGDSNHDRIVDIKDLYALASNWQGSGKVFSQGDFNYDGKVDAADLGILASHWQAALPLPAPAVLISTVPASAVRAPTRRTPVRVVTLIE